MVKVRYSEGVAIQTDPESCSGHCREAARNLGGLIHARTRMPGRLGKATSRTPSMYVDEKSDEAIVPAKRLNNGRQLSAEVVEGRASPKGNSR